MKRLSVLSRHEQRRRLKNGDITLTEVLKKELEALKQRPIDLADKDAAEVSNWQKVVVGKFYRPIKKQITIRLDTDVLAWFKSQPNKYQSLINLACRDYMLKHLENGKINAT